MFECVLAVCVDGSCLNRIQMIEDGARQDLGGLSIETLKNRMHYVLAKEKKFQIKRELLYKTVTRHQKLKVRMWRLSAINAPK